MEAGKNGMGSLSVARGHGRGYLRRRRIRRSRRRRRGGASRRRTSCRSWGGRTPASRRGKLESCFRREGTVQFAPVGVAQGGAGGVAAEGLTKKRGPKPSGGKREARKVRKLEREVARLREEPRKARIIIDVQGRVAGLLGVSPGGTESALERGQRLGRARGRTRGVPDPLGCARHVLPSPEAEDRAAAAPAGSCPGPGRGGARGGLRCAVLAALRRPRAGGGVRDAAGRGDPEFGRALEAACRRAGARRSSRMRRRSHPGSRTAAGQEGGRDRASNKVLGRGAAEREGEGGARLGERGRHTA